MDTWSKITPSEEDSRLRQQDISNYYKDNNNNIEDLMDIIYIDRGTFFAWIVTRVYIDNKIVIWKQLCDEDIDNMKPVKPL